MLSIWLGRFTKRLLKMDIFLFVALTLLVWSRHLEPYLNDRLLNVMMTPVLLPPLILIMMQGLKKSGSDFLQGFALFCMQTLVTVLVEIQIAQEIKFEPMLFFYGGACGIVAIGILGVISIYL